MVKQVKSRRAPAKRTPEFNAREFWLASLGAASLTRKQGIKLYGVMIDEGRALQSRLIDSVSTAGEQFNDRIELARTRFDKVVTPIRKRAEATLVVIKDEVKTRLQPVLAKFGVTKAKPRATAKRVVKSRNSSKSKTVKRSARRVSKAA